MPITPERVIVADRRKARRESTTNVAARLTLPGGVVVEGVFIDLGPCGGRFLAAADVRALPDSALVRVALRDRVLTARVVRRKRFQDGTQHVSVLCLEAVDDPPQAT